MTDTTATSRDPFGREFGDWEDPETEHVDCEGCAMCGPWTGRSYAQIRAARRAEVARRRAG